MAPHLSSTKPESFDLIQMLEYYVRNGPLECVQQNNFDKGEVKQARKQVDGWKSIVSVVDRSSTGAGTWTFNISPTPRCLDHQQGASIVELNAVIPQVLSCG